MSMPQQEEQPAQFDYLDYQDNERRLEQLKTNTDLERFKTMLGGDSNPASNMNMGTSENFNHLNFGQMSEPRRDPYANNNMPLPQGFADI